MARKLYVGSINVSLQTILNTGTLLLTYKRENPGPAGPSSNPGLIRQSQADVVDQDYA